MSRNDYVTQRKVWVLISDKNSQVLAVFANREEAIELGKALKACGRGKNHIEESRFFPVNTKGGDRT